MTEQTLILTAAIAYSAGAMSVGMWLGSRLARVTTDRNRLQAVVGGLRSQLESEREFSYSACNDAQLMADKIATLTSDCMEFQRLAHEWRDKWAEEKSATDRQKGWVNRYSIELSDEKLEHATTKRQLAAAKGQMTKLKRRMV